ncbi:MAG: FAD-binding protein [Actinomycetota bacterium]|nr:FAD-binding protein [Actinomycetota bacterium]
MMKDSAARELQRKIGSNKILKGEKALSPYFKNPIKGANLILCLPETVEELQDVVFFAHENEIPVYSVKRKYFDDENLARNEGFLVDLKGMNQIKKIDIDNLTAHIYGGVTYEQLNSELSKKNQRLLFPVSGETNSVLRSVIDRELLMGSTCYRHIQLSVFHAMLSNGEIWLSGSQ